MQHAGESVVLLVLVRERVKLKEKQCLVKGERKKKKKLTGVVGGCVTLFSAAAADGGRKKADARKGVQTILRRWVSHLASAFAR